MPETEIPALECIANWRLAAGGSPFDEVRVGAENQLTLALRHLFAMAEEHPELRASGEFQALASNLWSVEESLNNARRRYNATVSDYNHRIQTFPGSLMARLLGLQPKPFIEISCPEDRRTAAIELQKPA
jgi:LemA protein